MPRAATGQVVERVRAHGVVYGLRFVAAGRRQYVTLGAHKDGWTRRRAEVELENTLADVRRGIWTPPVADVAPTVDRDPTFHQFATDWFEAHKGEWTEATHSDYEWQLTHHLLPFFKAHRLSQITIAEVDRYRAAKVAEARDVQAAAGRGEPIIDEYVDARGRKCCRRRRALSATSINKTIARLGQVLEQAVEYPEYALSSNPARGKRRRLKASRPAPVWLDSAEQIEALLDAAGELDRNTNGHVPRRAILATFTYAGLRIGELIDLCWRDVNLADGRLTVGRAKTDAGRRTVDLLPALRDELLTLKAHAKAPSHARVFPTRTGGPMNPPNVRNRILAPTVKLASEQLEAAGATPLPAGLTPHKLRHTFTSVLVALGTDPGAVMEQLGHEDPAFTLRVYRHGMRRDPESKAKLAALVGVAEKAPSGTNPDSEALSAAAGRSTDPRFSAR
jgi:integrase